jgi:UDPglucose 6-dehydrogenase
MKLAVVGTGYVGLVAGVCFADTGHSVICVDVDQEKVRKLKDGIVPIYEPGLEDLMKPAIKAGRLSFTTELSEAVQKNDVIFIAVGTPESTDGSADLTATMKVVADIAKFAERPSYVVLKSTVPVGTAQQVQEYFDSHASVKVEVINNPEFLKEGAAVDDFLRPDRVVIGCRCEEAQSIMSELYEPFVRNGHPIIFMDNVSAEMTKYAANAFLSVKISFINELARLADKAGADVRMVRKGFTSDKRIQPAFFYPGVGFGGSCFPKDTKALIKTGEKHGEEMSITRAAVEVNERQKTVFFDYLKKALPSLEGKTVAVWGLAFKPRTDDVREAPALALIEKLTQANVRVHAYDPIANENAARASKVPFTTFDNAYEALKGADALIIMTEWNEFRAPDFDKIKSTLNQPLVFDGRNIFDPVQMSEKGFEYYSIGRQKLSSGKGVS